MARNDLPLNLRNAEHSASKLIERYGICAPDHIRLRDIAFNEKAVVVEEPVARAAARLTRIGGRATIRVSPSEAPKRKRFSIAHELGHLVLDHVACSIQKVCSNKDMMSWYKPDIETEANFFASELLMPSNLVEKMCDVAEVNLNCVRKIADEFRVSMTASAIRFVRFCPEKCAVVCSEDGKVSWSYKSADWWPAIPKGMVLDKRTIAYDFFKGEDLADEPYEIDADAWISPRGVSEIVEHAFGSRLYGFTLSILWIKP